MKKILIIITTLITRSAFSQEDSIPKQYQVIDEVYGDLDKDGINEKAAVYNMSINEEDENGIDREIIIFKKDKSGWLIWQRSVNACRRCSTELASRTSEDRQLQIRVS